tara:strand:+ start:419 stop:586 length:168 start_codon:yes stop_codon:yes gene_type:complete
MASDAYEDGKEMASDAYDASAEKAGEFKDAAAKKAYEACVKMKEQMGGDVSECEN